MLILEFLVTLVVPLPMFNNFEFHNINYEENIATFYTLNDIVILIMFLWLFIVFDILLKNINFASIRMDEILK